MEKKKKKNEVETFYVSTTNSQRLEHMELIQFHLDDTKHLIMLLYVILFVCQYIAYILILLIESILLENNVRQLNNFGAFILC